ncbi:MAG: AAA domain-containing protein [Bacteroidota bacterium]|nr:AAA domain-containing protein [Bacteroidota bacterium]
MSENFIADYFRQQKELIKIERDEEVRLFEQYQQNTSLEERKKKGITWYPLIIKETGYSIGEYPFVVVSRAPGQDHEHQLQSGKVAGLFNRQKGLESELVKGTIHYVEGNNLKLILNQDELPDWLSEGQVGINLLHDERSYKEMNDALGRISKAKENTQLANIRDILIGLKQPEPFDITIPIPKLGHLNQSQNDAVSLIVNSTDVAIIHGPPGTGKTTTLTYAIQVMAENVKRILVSSPSNAAADLLTIRLSNLGMSVIRMGNISRIDEEVISHTLDGKMNIHPLMKDIKRLRKESDEYKRLANKYKRHFGASEREQRKLLMHESKRIRADIRTMEDYLVEDLINQAKVVVCTLVGAVGKYLQDRTFDVAIIDEAAQGLEAATWIPISKSNKVILAGDPHQLPPTVKSQVAAKLGLNVTLIEKCLNLPERVSLLNVQYRMHNAIMGYSNQVFYDNQLQADESVAETTLNIPQSEPIILIDTAGAGLDEDIDPDSQSIYNTGEMKLVEKVLAEIVSQVNYADVKISCGIISPYREQVLRLKAYINANSELHSPNLTLSINTIDSFQGQERDIIIISMARSNPRGEIGFLKDYRRMNVAMTRAKSQLIIIGDTATLSYDSFYANMVEYLQLNGKYLHAFEM